MCNLRSNTVIQSVWIHPVHVHQTKTRVQRLQRWEIIGCCLVIYNADHFSVITMNKLANICSKAIICLDNTKSIIWLKTNLPVHICWKTSPDHYCDELFFILQFYLSDYSWCMYLLLINILYLKYMHILNVWLIIFGIRLGEIWSFSSHKKLMG